MSIKGYNYQFKTLSLEADRH